MQTIILGAGCHKELRNILNGINSRKFLLVCRGSFEHLPIKDFFSYIDCRFVKFSGFSVNPTYEEVVSGVKLFRKEKCDTIVAVGGGSSIDVAKCIKLFSKMPDRKNYLKQRYSDPHIPLIAIPTTAGTGSESTRFAVIYYKKQKQSVTHDSIIPDYALLDHSLLTTLPLYQKKCTLLDALCQAIESWWSVNSNLESIKYSEEAVKKIVNNYQTYLFGNDENAFYEIMLASNYAGQAINITQTTAAHAFSYKLTSLYGLPHGHAVALCLPHIWRYMLNNTENCIHPKGQEYLQSVFGDIAKAMNCNSPQDAVEFFITLLTSLDIAPPQATEDELIILTKSVNTDRLKNNPISLTNETIYKLYNEITE